MMFQLLDNTLASWVAKPFISSTLSVLMRAMLAAIFIIAGFGKMQDYAGTAGYMSSMGVSASLLPLVILLEFGGGLAILLGFQTRFAALALAVFSVASALIFHSGHDQMTQIMFMKNIAMAGGFLALVMFGAGRCSVDGLFKRNL